MFQNYERMQHFLTESVWQSLALGELEPFHRHLMNLGLRHGDRLQVSEAVPDPLTISQSVRFQNQQEVELRFFRASKQHPLRFVSDWGMVPG